MQIIIVQDEIETAIRNHIQSLISVRENMDINVDLAATRGSTGFTATINIVPAAAANPASGPMIQAAPSVPAQPVSFPVFTRSATVQPALRGATPEERAAIMEKLHAEDEAAEVTQAAQPEVAAEAETEQPEAPAAVEEPVPEAPVKEVKSLFKTMRRPTNS